MFNESNVKGLKKALREMKKANYSKLRNAVITDILSKGFDDEDTHSYLSDIVNHGLQSGIVGGLIYYSDTTKFYKKHKKDIMEILKDLLQDCGLKSPAELFGGKFDSDDYFIEEIQNQNLLAWFGYEETVRNITYELEIEDLL